MKKIPIKVIANAKKEKITEENGILKVYVSAPAVDGKANRAVIEALAARFGIKPRAVRIAAGLKSRNKIVEISS